MSSSDNEGNGVRASGNHIHNNRANNSGVGAGGQNFGRGAGSQYSGQGAGSQYSGQGAGSQYSGQGAGSQFHGPDARPNYVDHVGRNMNIGTGAGGTNSGLFSGSINHLKGHGLNAQTFVHNKSSSENTTAEKSVGRGTEPAPIKTENSHEFTKPIVPDKDSIDSAQDITSSESLKGKFDSNEISSSDSGSTNGAQSATKEKINESQPVASLVEQSKINELEALITDNTVINGGLEDELFAQLDLLADLPTKSKIALDPKEKSDAKEIKPDLDVPTHEQINQATQTLQELVNGDPSHFYKSSDQLIAFQAAHVLSRSPHLSTTQRNFWADFPITYADFGQRFLDHEKTVQKAEATNKSVADWTTAAFQKKSELLAIRNTHEAQLKNLQDQRGEISIMESKLAKLKKQLSKEEQIEQNQAMQRNRLHSDFKADLEALSSTKAQLTSLTALAKEAASELKHMRDEWSGWKNHLC